MLPPELQLWANIIGALTVVGSVIVGIYTARAARMANRETSQLTGWQSLVKGARDEITALRSQIEKDLRAKEAEIDELRQEVRALTTRVEQSEVREKELLNWARRVVTIMRDRQIAFPRPPIGVEETDPGR